MTSEEYSNIMDSLNNPVEGTEIFFTELLHCMYSHDDKWLDIRRMEEEHGLNKLIESGQNIYITKDEIVDIVIDLYDGKKKERNVE